MNPYMRATQLSSGENTTKLALITGGSRGIGAATAALLRERKWDVDKPPRSVLDFADTSSVSAYLVDWLVSLLVPEYDAVVFCHGEWYSRSPWQSPRVDPAQAWYRQHTLRVFSPMYILQFLLGGDPRWHPKCVIMVSSTRGLIGGVDTGPYSAACAAQIALMQGYAREYPGTRFNCVAPGWTDTDMGRLVKTTGGVSNPNAVPQPAEFVAKVIVGLIEDEQANGYVVRAANGKAERVEWTAVDVMYEV